MNFREATGALTACHTMGEIAEAIGVAKNTVLRARMVATSPNARAAPPRWEKAVVKLARKRAADLVKLAVQLER